MPQMFLFFIIAYFLGSIPNGVWIGQKFFHTDIRRFGSGNIGTTNTFRVLGVRAGIVVLILDMLKGTLATLLPILFHVNGVSPILFGICAILGHTFPVFCKFKGGKAVATSAGMVLAYSPWFFLYLAGIFLLFLFLTSMVSLSSILVSLVACVSTFLLPLVHSPIMRKSDPLFSVLVLLVASFICYRHKPNIARILQKKENIVPFGLNFFNMKSSKK